MGLIMLVQLYTSRVILDFLGVQDYGIYSIVASFVIAFTFISGPLTSATQRFISYSLGKSDFVEASKVFSMSLNVYVLLSVVVLLIVEIFGVWFLNNKLDLPQERMSSINIVFQFSVITLLIGLIQTPYNAIIVAFEKMSFYAYLSVVEIFLKLLLVFLLELISFDKLILYSILSSVSSFIILLCYFVYARRKISCSRYKFQWDKNKFKSLISFSGWSLLGSVATMTTNQGLNILLNIFSGVVINAAMGLANQVNVSVSQFVLNFQIAFQPQIVKLYASGDFEFLKGLINNTAKYSYLLLFAILCPLFFNIDYILFLWLDNVPYLTSEFCVLLLICTLIDTLSSPLWMTIQASGKIRMYQIIISSILFLNIIFSYVFLKFGVTPIVVVEIKVFVTVIALISRLLFLRKLIKFDIKQFFYDIILKLLIFSFILIFLLFALDKLISTDKLRQFFITIFVFYPAYSVLLYFIVFNENEKVRIRKIVSDIFKTK